MLKVLKQILKVFFILLFLAAGGSISYLVIKKDEILQKTIAAVNKSLTTPVSVKKIDFSLFSNWPNAAIVLEDVSTAPPDGFQNALIEAEKISLSVDLLSILAEEYNINEVVIEDAQIALEISPDGQNNFTLFKQGSNETSRDSIQPIAIKRIALLNSTLRYLDFSRRTPLVAGIATEELIASTTFDKEQVALRPAGDIRLLEFDNGTITLPANEVYEVAADLTYFSGEKTLNIGSSRIVHSQFRFQKLTGTVDLNNRTTLDISFDLPDCRYEDLKKLIPARYIKPLNPYQLTTNISAGVAFKGALDDLKGQQVDVDFRLRSLAATYPAQNLQLSNHSITGQYRKMSGRSYDRAVLENVEGTGLVQGHETNYQFVSAHVDGEQYDGDISGNFSGQAFMDMKPELPITELTGDFQYELHLFKSGAKEQTDGQVVFEGVSFNARQLPERVSNLQGTALFNNSELALQELSGNIGTSDFSFSGYIINPENMAKAGQPYLIDGQLTSKRLLLDDLLVADETVATNNTGTVTPSTNYTPPSQVNLQLQVTIDQLQYRRFRGERISGNLSVKNSRIMADDFRFNAIGGPVSGSFVLQPAGEYLQCRSNVTIEGLHADSIFYVFENFDQQFILDRHLSGQITANATSELLFKTNLTPIPRSLKSTIEATIANGRLIKFQPMYRLSRFVDEEQLAELSFSQISNRLSIENGVVQIPEMRIESNVSNIDVSGWHTLDQRLEYHLKVPLKRKYKQDKDERYGVIEDPEKNVSNLFLKVTGTTDDYKFAYDKKAVLNKVKDDIKQEGKDLINAFKLKGKKKEEQTSLSENDFFDFSDSTKVKADTVRINQ